MGWPDEVKSYLGLKSEEDSDWLQRCLVSCSPLGGRILLAFEHTLFYSVSKSEDDLCQASVKRWILNKEGPITAILCLPILGSSKVYFILVSHCKFFYACLNLQSKASGHLEEHFFIVGHENGVVQILTETGQVLIRKELQNGPVVKISWRCWGGVGDGGRSRSNA